MDEVLEQAFQYHKWANLQLLDVCGRLTPVQLELTSTGTYGSIAATWQHLLSAEQRYIYRLGGPRPRMNERSEFPGIVALTRTAARSADELIATAKRIRRGAAGDFTFGHDGYRLSLWVIAVQAIHHGNDHRTHICTVLGQNGVDYGDLDVWAFGRAAGAEKHLGRRR